MSKICDLTSISGRQDSEGYHLIIKCNKCQARGVFFLQDKEDVRFDKDYPYDKTKYSCPGEQYYAELQKNQVKNTDIVIRKGSIIETKDGIVGPIMKYSSNIKIEIFLDSESNLEIKKEDIVKVIEY